VTLINFSTIREKIDAGDLDLDKGAATQQRRQKIVPAQGLEIDPPG
jgi:hypothetical protein